MTTIAAPGAGATRSPRRAGLARSSWRLHRLALIGILAVFAACAARVAVTGISTHAAYASYLSRHCVTSRNPACPRLLGQMGNDSWISGCAPWLVGVFLGAPRLAREFETGSYRFSAGQGISRRRQVVATVLLGAVIVAVCGCMLGLVTTWAADPWHRIALGNDTGMSYWDPGYFWVTAVTLPALSVLDFSIGVLAGALIRRTVPAIAATVAGVLAVTALGTGFGIIGAGPDGQGAAIRALLGVAPRTMPGASVTGGPSGSLLLRWWYAGRSGRHLSHQALEAVFRPVPPRLLDQPAAFTAWLARRHITPWITFQPAGRFWPFQAICAAVLAAAAAAMLLGAIRLDGRKG